MTLHGGFATFAVVLAAALLGGCASPQEHQAFQQYVQTAGADYPSSAGGQPAPGPGITDQSSADDYVAYAARSNPWLQAAFVRWKAALEQIPQARALPDPQFTYKYFVVEQMMRDGAMRHMYELSQTFPWFGKLELRGDMAIQEARAAASQFDAQRLQLIYRVKKGYYEYYYVTRAVAVARENLKLLESIQTIARSRYEAGSGSQPDLIRAQVEAGKLDDDLRSLQDLLTPTRAELAAALNLPAGVALPSPRAEAAALPGLDEAALRERLVRDNPELAGMNFDVQKERQGIALARKDYFPDVMLGYEFDQMVPIGGMRDDMSNPQAVMVSVNVPIWWEKYSAEVRQAQARYRAAQDDRLERLNSLSSELSMALYSIRDAQRKMDLYGQTLLPKAKSAVESTQAAFQSGSAMFFRLDRRPANPAGLRVSDAAPPWPTVRRAWPGWRCCWAGRSVRPSRPRRRPRSPRPANPHRHPLP